jgi:TPR repeat protein
MGVSPIQKVHDMATVEPSSQRRARSGRRTWLLLGAASLLACADPDAQDRRIDHELARAGDLDAMHRLCFDYSYGERGLPQDYGEARAWCAAAAARGNASTQTLYAQLLEYGEGGPQDLAGAARWYRRAAEQGHLHAQYVLGLFFLDGRGVAVDTATADSLLQAASIQGMREASRVLRELRRRHAPARSRAPTG